MNTIVRSTNFSLSRRVRSYEPLDRSTTTTTTSSNEMKGDDFYYYFNDKRALSKRKKNKEIHKMMMMTSLSYRRDRAKKRLVFLKSYKLKQPSSSSSCSSKKNGDQKSVFVKAKAVAVLAVSFIMRLGSLRSWRSCRSTANICASSPVPIEKNAANYCLS